MSTLIKPHVTEKAASLSKNKQFVFIVNKKANKVEIQKEFTKRYNLTPLSINTARYAGKKITRYTKKRVTKGQKPLYKKAIITIPKEANLDLQSYIL